jgi:oxygen-independent coproporphyrinogen-3 oxidase
VTHGVYLHIPFCTHRCAYCDFNTYAGLESLIPSYVEAMCAEASMVGEAWPEGEPRGVDTIFFGGGTPSLLPADSLHRILDTLRGAFEVETGAEITLEANPGTVTRAGLGALREAGINRLSLGAQSADPSILRLLERAHDFGQVEAAVREARSVGFDNLNLDLMLGVMTQTMESWRDSLQAALGLQPEHLSLYMLSVEEDTPLAARVHSGILPAPEADLAAEMYEAACAVLEAAGYLHYEISNWARRRPGSPSDQDARGWVCRHNLRYWRNLPYLGLGAGAHGSTAGFRYANVLSPQAYIQRLTRPNLEPFPFSVAAASRLPIDRDTAMRETMLMGLRLLEEGVPAGVFRSRFGLTPQEAFLEVVSRWQAEGLLELQEDRLRLTRRGWLLSNQVFVDLV